MSSPVLVSNCTYIYFTCDRDPTATESIVSAVGIPNTWLFYWWNTTTNDIWVCQNGSSTPLVWWKHLTNLNIGTSIPNGTITNAMLTGSIDLTAKVTGTLPVANGGTGQTSISGLKTALGLNIDTNRAYSSVTLAFGTPRTPSTTSDTFVVTSLQATVAVLQTSTMNVQVNTGSGYITLATFNFSGVVSTKCDSFSFIVPANSSYQITSGGTATNTIQSIFELSM